MQYANTLLSNWNDLGYKTLQQVKKNNVNITPKSTKKTFERKSFSTRSYSEEELSALFDNLEEINI